MNTKKRAREFRMRCIFLLRSAGPTSMPWNDLYGVARGRDPGILYPPIVIGAQLARGSLQYTACGGASRRYINTGLLGGLTTLLRLAAVNRRRGKKLLVHVHNPSLAVIAVAARILSGNVRIVGNLHNDWTRFNLGQKTSLWLLGLCSSAFITVSEAIVQSIPSRLRRSLRKRNVLFSIRNGIPSQELERAYPIGVKQERSRDVVVVARMVPQKNMEMILQVFSQLKHANRLVWFGDGPEREKLLGLAKQLGIESRVVLKGMRPRYEVLKGLAGSEVYLACSRWEGIGVANLEAAAMGCLPFLSKIPAHQEIGRELGIPTFDLLDDRSWVDAIDGFLAEQDEVRTERVAGIARLAREKFVLSGAVDRYLEVYRNLD